MMLVDHHCHLDFPKLADQREDVIARARDAGVGILVTISTRIAQRDALIEIAESDPNIFCTLGTHPHNADEELHIGADEIIRLSDHPKIIGLGEAGLDYYYDNSPREAQRQGFLNHIHAARETGLPLVIHARDADDDTADILETEMAKGPFKFVLHCFTAGPDLAKRALALGGYISFSGVVTFKTATELQKICADVPADRYLVETDAPFLAPMPMRGKTNEPAFVRHTAEFVAGLRGVDLETVARETTENFFRLYDKANPDTAKGGA